MMWGPLIALMLSQQPERCTLRVSARGIYVDGDKTTRARAVATCKRTSGAVVIVEDDAPSDAWPDLRARLTKAHVEIVLRGEVNDLGHCFDNPLAKGCP